MFHYVKPHAGEQTCTLLCHGRCGDSNSGRAGDHPTRTTRVSYGAYCATHSRSDACIIPYNSVGSIISTDRKQKTHDKHSGVCMFCCLGGGAVDLCSVAIPRQYRNTSHRRAGPPTGILCAGTTCYCGVSK